MSEIWKPIERLSCEVSNLGRIRNCLTRRILKPVRHTHGYLQVSIGIGGKRSKAFIHRLVCEAFNGPPPEGFQCDHINMVRWDNRAENLRWVTPEFNKSQRRHPQGEDRAQAKLRTAEVNQIRRLLPTRSNSEIGSQFGVSRRTIADIRNGVTWR